MIGFKVQQTILADPDEILLIRDAGVQVWHQRQDSDGQQGDLLKCKLNGCLRFFFSQGKPAEESKSKSAIAIDDCQFHQCVNLLEVLFVMIHMNYSQVCQAEQV